VKKDMMTLRIGDSRQISIDGDRFKQDKTERTAKIPDLQSPESKSKDSTLIHEVVTGAEKSFNKVLKMVKDDVSSDEDKDLAT
jgi:hypothetical protein